MGFVIAGSRRFQRFRRPEYQLQHAAGAVIYAAYGERPILDRLQDLFFHVVAAAGHIQVAACPEAFDAVIHRTPIGDHHTVKAPFAAEDIRQQLLMVGAMGAVQLGVSAHHGGGLALLHRNFKGRQIKLPQGAAVHHAVGGKTAQLLRVSGKMLQAGAHALRFGTPDKACCQFARKIGVLAEIFKVAPAERVALEVGTGAENKPDPLLLGFFPDGCADFREQFRIPASGSGHLRRKAGGWAGLVDPQHIRHILLLAQAVRAVAHEKGRNAVFFVFLCFPDIIPAPEQRNILLWNRQKDRYRT